MALALNQGTIALAILTVVLTLLGRFVYTGYRYRRLASKYPGPPHHPIFGHLHLMADAVKAAPKDVAGQSLPEQIRQKYNLPDLYYLDVWPAGPSMLVSCHPDISNQFTVKNSRPKHQATADFTKFFGRGDDMVAADGPQWKTWRAAFNPGFSPSHLMTLMPLIVDDVSKFVTILREKAVKNELFRMEHPATRLTIDIIGKIVLDDYFNSQSCEHELVSAFESQVRWIPTGVMNRPSELFNIFRPLVMRYNLWRMDRYLGDYLDKRFASRKDRSKTKHVVDLALEMYLKENKSAGQETESLDKAFKQAAITNIKIFIFAGHDTSSGTITFALYQLSRYPEALVRLRKECDEIFGTDLSKTGDVIKAEPHLLNKMEYANAVIRETLRLHPPASTVREGSKDFFLTDPSTGERYPTEDLMIWAHNMGTHLSPKLFGPDPMTFRPERWFKADQLSLDSYIPFSKGPRNCIGQELALLEIRMVLAMTVREFDFKAAFDEVEKLKGDGSGYPSNLSGVQQQFGEQAYQIQMGTAKPREGMPCRLSIAKR